MRPNDPRGWLSSTSRIKSVLVTPKDNWPPYRRGTGLTMECLGTDRDGAQVFRYVHNADYADGGVHPRLRVELEL